MARQMPSPSWADESTAVFNFGVGPFRSAADVIASGPIAGDLIEFQRTSTASRVPVYRHWGVYVGNGRIVHVKRLEADRDKSIIVNESIEEVCAGDKCRVNNLEALARTKYAKQNSHEVTAQNALDKVGTINPYALTNQNCESFATSCKYSTCFSGQVSFLGRFFSFVGQVLGGRAGMEMIAASGRGNGWSDDDIIDFIMDRD